MEDNVIDFKTAKAEIELQKIKQENKKLLTKTALTCNYSQYLLMDYMCNFVETSKKIANDPILKEKHKKLLKTRNK